MRETLRSLTLVRAGSVAFVALAAAGCTEEEGLTLGLGVDASAAEVATLVVDVEGSEHTIERGDILVRRRIELEPGTYSVRLTLLDTAGATLVETELEKRIREDHDHWIDVLVQSERPMSVCGLPDLALDIDASDAAADTMFVMSGGMRHGSIC